MSRLAYCLQQAQLCIGNAQRSKDPDSRNSWMEMASHWQRLAGEVEGETDEQPMGLFVPPHQQIESDQA